MLGSRSWLNCAVICEVQLRVTKSRSDLGAAEQEVLCSASNFLVGLTDIIELLSWFGATDTGWPRSCGTTPRDHDPADKGRRKVRSDHRVT